MEKTFEFIEDFYMRYRLERLYEYIKLNNLWDTVRNVSSCYDKKLDKLINDILPQIYSQIFHLRMNLIQRIYEIEDYINDDDNTEFIEYNLGESQFSYDYYGDTNKTINLYNENVDGDYNCEEENNENVNMIDVLSKLLI